MKAIMRQGRGTVWGNNIEIELSTELDVPHKLTTAELALSMVLTMQTFVEVLRAEDDRAIANGATLTAQELLRNRVREAGGDGDDNAGRERERLDEMRVAREQGRDREPTT